LTPLRKIVKTSTSRRHGTFFLDPEKTDLGHKTPWREKKKEYEKEGLGRKEVIERENDPTNLQWEDRYDNRSHKYEPK